MISRKEYLSNCSCVSENERSKMTEPVKSYADGTRMETCDPFSRVQSHWPERSMVTRVEVLREKLASLFRGRGLPFSKKRFCPCPRVQQRRMKPSRTTENRDIKAAIRDLQVCKDSVGKYVVTALEVGDNKYHLNISIKCPESNVRRENWLL